MWQKLSPSRPTHEESKDSSGGNAHSEGFSPNDYFGDESIVDTDLILVNIRSELLGASPIKQTAVEQIDYSPQRRLRFSDVTDAPLPITEVKNMEIDMPFPLRSTYSNSIKSRLNIRNLPNLNKQIDNELTIDTEVASSEAEQDPFVISVSSPTSDIYSLSDMMSSGLLTPITPSRQSRLTPQQKYELLGMSPRHFIDPELEFSEFDSSEMAHATSAVANLLDRDSQVPDSEDFYLHPDKTVLL
jgi:hypothetical protein